MCNCVMNLKSILCHLYTSIYDFICEHLLWTKLLQHTTLVIAGGRERGACGSVHKVTCGKLTLGGE